jgi:hypothetical protein
MLCRPYRGDRVADSPDIRSASHALPFPRLSTRPRLELRNADALLLDDRLELSDLCLQSRDLLVLSVCRSTRVEPGSRCGTLPTLLCLVFGGHFLFGGRLRFFAALSLGSRGRHHLAVSISKAEALSCAVIGLLLDLGGPAVDARWAARWPRQPKAGIKVE